MLTFVAPNLELTQYTNVAMQRILLENTVKQMNMISETKIIVEANNRHTESLGREFL